MSTFIHVVEISAGLWSASIWRATVEGGIAIAFVWVIARWCKFLSPRVIHWAWRLVGLKLLIALCWGQPVVIAVLPAKPIVAVKTSAARIPSVEAPIPIPKPAAESPTMIPPTVPHENGFSSLSILMLCWIVGACCCIAVAINERRRVGQLRRNATPTSNSFLQQACRQEAGRLRVGACRNFEVRHRQTGRC